MASHLRRCHRNNVQRPSRAVQISVAAAKIIVGNADLVMEILKRLPVKSLFRFRSVSKTWLFLISSHRFSLLHWLHQQPPQFHDPKISGLFFTSRSGSGLIKFIPLIYSDLKNSTTITINGGDENNPLAQFTDVNTSTTVDSSCNGFLLICCQTKLYTYSGPRRSFHVYNPTTKQFSTLPWPFSQAFTFPGENVFLVFDPLKSLHYKVVLLQSKLHRSSLLCQLHIYSSETNAWSSPPNIGDQHSFRVSLRVNLNNGVYCNGSIHWISYSQLENSIYFDVDEERFCSMPSPPFLITVYRFWHFGKSRGHLHFINYYDDNGFNVNVFEMESDYSKWTLKYRVDLNAMVVDLASKEEMVVCDDTVSVLRLIHGEDEGDVFLVLFVGTNMIISYNIKDNIFKKLADVGRHPVSSSRGLSWFKDSSVYRYIETIFPV
ncbi:F-box protein At5g07610-like [Cornus florida]|uniref:F-box protein At5g07610-like n=1 Tax=Cornus florida TaxID=4283 RepID=UPI0028996C68|nr:F-box protein At5g07610-like [Cornus florida]